MSQWLTLGSLVTVSKHPEATVWMVKRIDSEEGAVWLVAADGSGHICGWVSAHSVWKVQA